MPIAWSILLILGALATFGHAAEPADDDGPGIKAALERLGVMLNVTQRPRWPEPPGPSLEVTLVPQVDESGVYRVSFGIPFGPGWLSDDGLIRAIGGSGEEIPVFSKPLVYWWIDQRKGSLRSVLVQFEVVVQHKTPQTVTITWNRPRTRSLKAMIPIPETQQEKHVDPPADHRRYADSYRYRCPKVLALLPTEWLCASLLAWQQVPAKQNQVAPWYDEHLLAKFDYSTRNISANRAHFSAHLFDRPATYAEVYVRHGQAKHLLAALRAGDFYIQHLGPDGFFDIKPEKDHKYVYAEGSAILYMLTGDERYRQAVARAVKSWDTYTGFDYTGVGFWTERHTGFGMLAYVHAYELSGDERLLDKARRYFEVVLRMQIKPLDGKEPDGAWLHAAGSHGDGRGWTTSPWMSCFLTDAIWRYWMLSGDRRCPASLAMYAKFTERWSVTADGRGMQYMANSPGRGAGRPVGGPAHNVGGIRLLALGHYFADGTDESFLKKIETLWPPVMQDGANSPARKFNWRFRGNSLLIWLLTEAEKGKPTARRPAP